MTVRRKHNRSGPASMIYACLLLVTFCSQALAQLGQKYGNSPLYGPRPELGSTDNGLPRALDNVGIDQKLNEQLPLDLVFRDETGRDVRLGDYFNHGRPVILSFVYYECPMLCNEVLNGLAAALKTLSFDAGKEFDVLTVSFDARETSQLAAAKKASYMARYNRPGADQGWHFLTGDQKSIDALTSAVGFRYAYDAATKQFAHAGGIMLTTAEGRLARYFYGIEYAPRELRLGIVEASANKIGSAVDQLLLYCFHYDPATGKYGLAIINIVRLAGVLTVACIVALLLFLRRRHTGSNKEEFERGRCRLTLMQSWIPFMPEQASTFAPKVDALYFYLVGLTIFFTVLIVSVIIFFAVKYRRRAPFEVPRPIAGSIKLETLWSVIPFLILMSIFVAGANLYFLIYRVPKAPGSMEIFVVGKQWMWKFQHTTGQREINELHVPVGRKVKLTMTTEDVIHDLFIPAFRTKADVVPGRYTTLWFEATKPGRYHIFCAEYCGTNHSGMGGWIVVMAPADFDDWLSGNANQQSPVLAGQELFTTTLGCASCHSADGQGGRGAPLVGLFGKDVRLTGGGTVLADEAYIRESIVNPQAHLVAGYPPIMPTFKGQLTEEQLLHLVAYIKSLSPEQVSGPATTAPGASNNPNTNRGGGESNNQNSAVPPAGGNQNRQ